MVFIRNLWDITRTYRKEFYILFEFVEYDINMAYWISSVCVFLFNMFTRIQIALVLAARSDEGESTSFTFFSRTSLSVYYLT